MSHLPNRPETTTAIPLDRMPRSARATATRQAGVGPGDERRVTAARSQGEQVRRVGRAGGRGLHHGEVEDVRSVQLSFHSDRVDGALRPEHELVGLPGLSRRAREDATVGGQVVSILGEVVVEDLRRQAAVCQGRKKR